MASEVWVDVRFRGLDEIPVSVLTWGLACVNAALRESAADDLRALAEADAEAPRAAIERALAHLAASESNALQVVDTKRGSLGVIAVCPALAAWTLERSLSPNDTHTLP